MPIALVQNERTAAEAYEHWKDITGEQYHFPNQYKNRVVPGQCFIYDRGTRRADGKTQHAGVLWLWCYWCGVAR